MRHITEDEKFHLIVRRWIRLNPQQTTKLKIIRALVTDYQWAGMMESAKKPFENLEAGLEGYQKDADHVA